MNKYNERNLLEEIQFNWFIMFIILLNVLLLILRFTVKEPDLFQGNMFSLALFSIILISLLLTFFLKKYDYFIIIWLSFYFASPIIKIPFTDIGSLGILNIIFIPLMLLASFNIKNKYFILICLLSIFSLMNIYITTPRLVLSSIIQVISVLVFFYFTLKKVKNTHLIFYAIIIITLVNIPLSIYESIARPAWGITEDWRGTRIMGNLFHPNSFSMYLLPIVLLLYVILRDKFEIKYLILLIAVIILDILTLSRIGLATLIISLFLFELFYRIKNKSDTLKLFLPLLLTLLILFSFINVSDNHLKAQTISERTGIWKSMMPYIKDNFLLGLGAGSYESYRNEITNNLSPHNVYLSILFELGLIGLTIILIFVFFIIKDTSQNIIRNKQTMLFTAYGQSLMAGILVFSFTDSAPFSQVVSLNSWIILACCIKHIGDKK